MTHNTNIWLRIFSTAYLLAPARHQVSLLSPSFSTTLSAPKVELRGQVLVRLQECGVVLGEREGGVGLSGTLTTSYPRVVGAAIPSLTFVSDPLCKRTRPLSQNIGNTRKVYHGFSSKTWPVMDNIATYPTPISTHGVGKHKQQSESTSVGSFFSRNRVKGRTEREKSENVRNFCALKCPMFPHL